MDDTAERNDQRATARCGDAETGSFKRRGTMPARPERTVAWILLTRINAAQPDWDRDAHEHGMGRAAMPTASKVIRLPGCLLAGIRARDTDPIRRDGQP